MTSLTCLARRAVKGPSPFVLVPALIMALILGGCETPKVATDEAGTQAEGDPTTVFPPGVLSDIDPFGGFGRITPRITPGSPNVGLLLPLSGEHAAIGQALLNAAQLAVFDIAGDELVLIVRDTRGTPEGARDAARSALAAGASLILGPLFGESVTAVAEEARPRGVNVVSFSNNIKVAGDGVFVMGLIPGPQVERVVAYAGAQGYLNFAVFAPSTPYGQAVVTAMVRQVDRSGASLARIMSFDPDQADPSPQVRVLGNYDERREELLKQRAELAGRDDPDSKAMLERLERLDTIGSPNFDAVMLPMGGRRLMTVAPLLAYYDIDPAEVRFLGTALWDDPRVSGEVTLRGGWFAAPSPEIWREFARRYGEIYGQAPPRLASLGYDAAALAAVLSRRAMETGRPPRFSAAEIAQASGFAGVDGIFRFKANGQVERGLAVLEVTSQGVEVIDPAPVSFEELIN